MIRARELSQVAIALAALCLLVAACAPAAPAPARPAAAPPAASAPTAAAVQATPAQAIPGVPADWEKRWSDLVAAAQKEGRLVFAGQPNPTLRTTLPAKFKERFGIEMEYLAYPPNPGDFVNRLVREQASGVGSVDAMIIGAQSIYTVAYPEKMMAPIRPLLLHPEVLDPAKWTTGKPWFRDPDDMYFLQLINYISGQLVVNTDHVRADEIKSWADLLDPRYTGRISAWEPTVPGPGWNNANWVRHALGDDFFKRLYVDQRVAIPADARQWSDWMARGTYPIALGLGSRDVEVLKNDGFPVAVLPSFPEAPGHVSGGFGVLVLPRMAPNPNAAALFANWIASREGLELWGRGDQVPTLRTDLDNSWAPAYTIPVPGVQYFDDYDWNYINTAFPESLPKIKQIMAQR